MAKKYAEFNTQKRIEAEKYDDKYGKALSKLMNELMLYMENNGKRKK